ncbi:hypothetical protein POL68_25240 [Stigmatella sp. ncwal1]|uniref:Tetratricopeptide repeat-containing protein n=1 Tax=Stigmatella ashevillensis TaxID=2995309 RepID=A0ABT5DDX4_9BACT|nr:hypothetical protein [Stigmatella ashevillena]MDC0711799.1 hypothetical protein [Stigmatella ashevillena]
MRGPRFLLLRLLALCWVGWAVTFTPAALAQDDFQSAFADAERFYENLDYEHALDQIQRAKRWAQSINQQVNLGLFEGIVLGEMGKRGPSLAAFHAALLLAPEARLPFKVAPKVARNFEEMRRRIRATPPRKRSKTSAPQERTPQAKLPPVPVPSPPQQEARTEEPPPPEEKVVLEPPPAAVVVKADRPEQESTPARLPVPSVSNAKPYAPRAETGARSSPRVVPWILAGTGAAALGGAVVFGLKSNASVEDARRTSYLDETRAHLADARANSGFANILFGVAGLAATAAVVTWALSPGDPSSKSLSREVR